MVGERQTLFIVSDRTGITLEQLVKSLLTQYDGLAINRIVKPFLDTPAKVDEVIEEIDRRVAEAGPPPIIFSSIVDQGLRLRLRGAKALVLDIFDTYLPPLSQALGLTPSEHIGLSHGISDLGQYDRRLEALNFALNYDDGARFRGLETADLILVGVSRSGKTPTCLYLAMQYAIRAANFPLTEDDFLNGVMPGPLQDRRALCFGLTISPERLHRIREERRPGADYASIGQCRREVAAAEDLFRSHSIPFVDSTMVSIEELSIEIMQRVGVARSPY